MAGMGGINGSNSVYTQASQLPGFGGLASGLDRDTLIEQMTSSTRVKIAQTNQKVDLVKWEQESIRGITDKMYDFSNKYMSFSSSTNLTSSKLFAKSQITPVGENSKYIGISGNATGKNMFQILGVKQMAQDAKITSGTRVSESAMTTKPIDFTNGQKFSKIAGDSITFETGNGDGRKTYKITIPTEDADGNPFDLSNTEGVAEAMQYAINEYNKDAGDAGLKLEVGFEGNKLKFTNTSDSQNGNEIRIVSSTGDIQTELGIEAPTGGAEDAKFTIKPGQSVNSSADIKDNLVGTKPMHELLKGAELTFDYNGKTEKIVFKEEDLYKVGPDGKVTDQLKPEFNDNPAEAYKTLLQSKLDDAFGKGRISVTLEGSTGGPQSLKMTTTTPDGNTDTSSVLTLKGGSSSLLGADGALGIAKGATNRINMGATLAQSGIKGINADKNENYAITINGTEFTFDKDATMNDVMKEINESDIGVTISYQAMSDKFTIASNESGASGSITVEGELATALFGSEAAGKKVTGQDAIVTIKYDGQDEAIDIVRDSNGFTVEGLEVSVKGTFGDYSEGKIKEDPATAVTFDANIDSQKTVDVVKDMVKDINELIDLVNKEMTTKPNRDYKPLTAEQKKEMSEDEIEKWEKKAKEGLLFNDSDLRGLANALRFSIPSNLRADLEKIGISISKDYKDNGKLVLDEEKLKTALEQDPQHVRELFNGNGSKDNKGLMGNLKTSIDKYAATTGADKGILVKRAGSTHAPTSMLQNQMLTQINEYNRLIDSLNARLKNEQDRYIKQFTSLETLISQMNSQSSYFAGMGGGY